MDVQSIEMGDLHTESVAIYPVALLLVEVRRISLATLRTTSIPQGEITAGPKPNLSRNV